jgi:23S rRNA (pseudouridine1915-N3)-methyltransferase
VAFSLWMVSVGKLPSRLQAAFEHYRRLLRPYADVRVVQSRSSTVRGGDVRSALRREADAIRRALPSGAYTVALGERGRCLADSAAFAAWVQKRRVAGRPLVFVVGGANGLDGAFTDSASEVLSLSPLTYPHDLCLVVLAEQLYRTFTILNRHPYHR